LSPTLHVLLVILLVELALAGVALVGIAGLYCYRLALYTKLEQAARLEEERELQGPADLLNEVRHATRS